jgi:DNA polymerase-3 subunit gamma/tau
MRGDTNGSKQNEKVEEKIVAPDEPYSPEALNLVWNEYTTQRKKYQAEYQLLMQPYELRGNQIVVLLHSPVHETMLNGVRLELGSFLRERLKNNSIQILGEFVKEGQEKKAIYTNREKFEYLAEKNPVLKELKDRFGLDTDF